MKNVDNLYYRGEDIMHNNVIAYQNAFNAIIDRIKEEESILAVMVFGSMVTGDLWEESDIDLFVIVDCEENDIKKVYTQENSILIHMRIISKSRFMEIYEENLKGGYIHRVLSSSKLVFSKDLDITSRYDSGRFFPDVSRGKWNMVFLSRLLKYTNDCKKYISTDSINTAYSILVKCIEEYAKLFMSISGYLISKDVVNMSMDLNDIFKKHVEDLFYNEIDTVLAMNNLIEFIQLEVDKNIKNLTVLLIDYMRSKDKLMSGEEIKNDKVFKEFDIDMEVILNKLWKMNIINRGSKKIAVGHGKLFLEENVYFL